jgi:hypothetical protein
MLRKYPDLTEIVHTPLSDPLRALNGSNIL